MSRGLTKNYFRVFEFLESTNDYTTIDEISSRLKMNRSSVHRVLVRLVENDVANMLPLDTYQYKINPDFIHTEYGKLLENSRRFFS